jgi:fibronectin type 3 domain-containing protein
LKTLFLAVLFVAVAAAQTAHQVTLNWLAPPVAPGVVISGYNVYRADNSGGQQIGIHVNTSIVPNLTYIDTTVQGGKTYYYKVTMWCQSCTSGQQESAFSNETIAPVPGGVPQPPTHLTSVPQ